jgi:hypothetical protein
MITLSLSLSLSLSLLHKKHLTNLIVGGGSAGQPPAGLSCFASQDTDEGMSLMSPRHRTKNCINTLAPSVGTTWSLLPKKKSRTVTGDRKHSSSRKGEQI